MRFKKNGMLIESIKNKLCKDIVIKSKKSSWCRKNSLAWI